MSKEEILSKIEEIFRKVDDSKYDLTEIQNLLSQLHAEIQQDIWNSNDALWVLKNIIRSAPITGLPLALELDIQSACNVIKRSKK